MTPLFEKEWAVTHQAISVPLFIYDLMIHIELHESDQQIVLSEGTPSLIGDHSTQKNNKLRGYIKLI